MAGERLDRAAALLLVLTLCAGAGFTLTYLIEGATRAGYDAFVQPISALSLGPGGWVQQANFIVFGVVTATCSTLAWRRLLAPGFGATWFPALRGLEGGSLVVVGLFSMDSAGGYPPGTLPAPATLHGEIHSVVSYVAFASLAASLLLARRFSMEARWRAWTWPTVLFALLPVVFIVLFGSSYGHAPAGVYERLASSAGQPFGWVIVIRLLLQGRPRTMSISPSTVRPIANAPEAETIGQFSGD